MATDARGRGRRPVAVDLFCGAGGMSLGFEQAGFDVCLAVDADGYHAAVHDRNFPLGTCLCRSVADLAGADVFAALGGATEVDLVFGGPPCQGFSRMGLRDAADPRNALVRQFVRLVGEVRPRAFVMENVPGMLSGSTRPVLDDALAGFRAAGYRIAEPLRVVDARDCGVPQKRRRLFVLGLRDDLPGRIEYPAYPPPGQPPRPTVWEAIGDLPDVDARDELFEGNDAPYDREPASPYARVMRGLDADPTDFSHPRAWDRGRCTGCLRVRHGEKAAALYAATRPGATVPGHKLPRLDPDGVAPTLRAGTDSAHGSYTAPRPVHPFAPRCITAREAARLHGFPDWFSPHPLKWHAYRQIGNAVCPPVARAVGREVMKALGLTPTRPKAAIVLADTFALPDDRPRTPKRIPRVLHFPPVVARLFERAYDAGSGRPVRPRFSFADVLAAVAATGVDLSQTRADTFLSEIGRSRNVRRILDSCLARGFTIREASGGDALGEFVPVGHPEAIEGKAFLRLGSRELGAAPAVAVPKSVRTEDPASLFALLDVPEVVAALWEKPGLRVERRPSELNGRTATAPYRVAKARRRVAEGCAAAYESGAVPNRARLVRLATAVGCDELVVLVPVTTKHVLAALLLDCAAAPREAARGVFEMGSELVWDRRETSSAPRSPAPDRRLAATPSLGSGTRAETQAPLRG